MEIEKAIAQVGPQLTAELALGVARERKKTWRLIGLCFAAGILGTALVLAGWHLYLDHVHMDLVWQLELNRDAAAQAQRATPVK